MRPWFLAVLVATLLSVFVACGSSGGEHGDHAGGAMGSGSGEGAVPGSAADDSDADRKVHVETKDDLSFDPSSIEVAAGEVVTFVVTNDGNADHEFVLGDSSYQKSHDGGDMDHGMGNAVTVSPGETQELTWEFSEPGEILYGCHEAGHYDGGMVGTITVE